MNMRFFHNEIDDEANFLMACWLEQKHVVVDMIEKGLPRTLTLQAALEKNMNDTYMLAQQLFIVREEKHLLEKNLASVTNKQKTNKI